LTLLALLLASAPDVLVLAPESMHPALKDWRASREARGLAVEVRVPGEDPAATVREVHRGSEGKLRYVLLLGDVDDVACGYRDGKAIAPFEEDPRIATDHACADLDGDALPDLAVGRVPADSRADAEALLGRVLAYEASRDFGPWRRRLNVVAGLAGFGPLADAALEATARGLLVRHVPESASLSVTWANPESPFCPDFRSLQKTVVGRFTEGALVVTYLGHGSAHALDRMRVGGTAYPILEREAASRLRALHGAPIAVIVACSTGQFDGGVDCLAEDALHAPGGPVAVVASSRVSMPYANGVFAKEMLQALFSLAPKTLGDWVGAARRRVADPGPGDADRLSIENAAALLYQPDAAKRALERTEHLFLYNLLGDPTMLLPLPAEAKVKCAKSVGRGARLSVSGSCELETGEALVELVEPRGRTVAKGDGYERANRWEVASVRAPVRAGAFEAVLAVPDGLAPGAYRVRVFVEGASGAAWGSRNVRVAERAP